MKKPSLWKQIADENAEFLGQFKGEKDYPHAGLSEADYNLVVQRLNSNKLKGITCAQGQWQNRFTINGKQEILFSGHSLTVAALMHDLLLSMLTRYPHCAPFYSKKDPKKENAIFNLPLSTRTGYAESVTETTFSVLNFLQRVEKLLLDKGILYPITPEEAAAREQIKLADSKQADSSAQLRYQKRRSTQLDQALEQIQTFGESASKLEELRARMYDWMDRKDSAHSIISQQLEFMTTQFESLKLAVGTMTATFQKLLDEARATRQ